MRQGGFCLLWLSLASAMLPSKLDAQYVDPGSVSILWQLLVAGVFGIVFTLRQRVGYLWHALVDRRKRSREKKVDKE